MTPQFADVVETPHGTRGRVVGGSQGRSTIAVASRAPRLAGVMLLNLPDDELVVIYRPTVI